MIDWFDLAANATWIFGCALALAVVSYANYDAHVRAERLRTTLSHPRARVKLNLAGVLVCLGIAGAFQSIWETALWLLLVLVFAAQAWGNWARLRRDAKAAPNASAADKS